MEPSGDQPDHCSCSKISPRANFLSALLNEVQVGNGMGRLSSTGELVLSKSNRRSLIPLPSRRNSYVKREENVLITQRPRLKLHIWF